MPIVVHKNQNRIPQEAIKAGIKAGASLSRWPFGIKYTYRTELGKYGIYGVLITITRRKVIAEGYDMAQTMAGYSKSRIYKLEEKPINGLYEACQKNFIRKRQKKNHDLEARINNDMKRIKEEFINISMESI